MVVEVGRVRRLPRLRQVRPVPLSRGIKAVGATLSGSSSHHHFTYKILGGYPMRYSYIGFLLLLLSSAVFAETTVPYTFVSGTAAKASEVNANFAALVTAINNLETRVTTLEASVAPVTAASLAGTYDVYEVTTDVDDLGTSVSVLGVPNYVHHYGMAGSAASGTAVFNADGTGQMNQTKQYRQLQFHEQFTLIGGVQELYRADVSLADSPEIVNAPFSWTFSNGVVTAGDINFVVASRRLLIGRVLSTDGQGHNGITILVHR